MVSVSTKYSDQSTESICLDVITIKALICSIRLGDNSYKNHNLRCNIGRWSHDLSVHEIRTVLQIESYSNAYTYREGPVLLGLQHINVLDEICDNPSLIGYWTCMPVSNFNNEKVYLNFTASDIKALMADSNR
jgi:hypothetical protein